jgi:hypothetical protein
MPISAEMFHSMPVTYKPMNTVCRRGLMSREQFYWH